jgi:hypothetical protein
MSSHRLVRSAIFSGLAGILLLPAAQAVGAGSGIASAQAVASIQLSRSQLAPGDAVKVTGYNFSPNDSAYVSGRVTVNGKPQAFGAPASTTAAGSFATVVTVPVGTAPGTYTLTAGDYHHHTAKRNLTVLPVVALTVDGKSQTIYTGTNHDFYVTGSGFKAGEAVRFAAVFQRYNGNYVTVVKNATADSKGNIGELLLVVPSGIKQGSFTVTATGATSGAKASGVVRVVYHPSITVASSQARPGQTVTVNGYGFVPNMRVTVAIQVVRSDGTALTLTKTATSGSKGDIVAAFKLPVNIKTGTYIVRAHGAATGATPQHTLTVTLAPTISAHPATVTPGGHLTLVGSGFSASTSIKVEVVFPLYGGGSHPTIVTATTNAQGGFSTALSVPSRALGGAVHVVASGPDRQVSATLTVQHIAATIAVSPTSVLPGGEVAIKGYNFPPNDTVSIAVPVTTTNGAHTTLTATEKTNGSGAFTATLRIPGSVSGGAYTVSARSAASGRSPSAAVHISTLKASIVASPATAIPGTEVTVNGFGFASGETVTLTLSGAKVGTATTGSNGTFSTKITVPSAAATGKYAVAASGGAGRSAGTSIAVNRQVSTHFYFASLYTGSGYHEYLAILNPSETKGRVTITYERKTGATTTKTIDVNAHSRFTEDVNADVGFHISASAALSADVPMVAERYVYHNGAVAGGPGVSSPASVWYFADGNTSGKYREYIAIQNPNSAPTQVTVRFLPTHRRPFSIVRTLSPTSRYTIKVNTYVHDAVGVTVRANAPVVANRTIYNKHGMTSKAGAPALQRRWYFAAGPRSTSSHNWIGAINPTPRAAHVTLRAFNALGQQVGSVQGSMKAGGRVGYLMNKIAHRANVSVVLTASEPIVAEQTTYANGKHDASTDTFGTAGPTKSWTFASVDTSNGLAARDSIALFNPSLVALPVVVQFMTTSGAITARTYVVGPMAQRMVDVGSVVPNAQLGIVATSSSPFVAMNRQSIGNGRGALTSTGIHF